MCKRELIYIPIVHTLNDMGALGESIKKASFSKIGKTAWKRKLSAIDQVWKKIETGIEQLNLHYEKVYLYQDGLPVCGKEEKIVRDLAKTGSRNHKILIYLIEKGATLMGTESPELLLEEYESYKKLLSSGNPLTISRREARQKKQAGLLLKKRDQFIADRINATLSPGDIGILFLGVLHSPGELIDPDIQVTYPVGKPL